MLLPLSRWIRRLLLTVYLLVSSALVLAARAARLPLFNPSSVSLSTSNAALLSAFYTLRSCFAHSSYTCSFSKPPTSASLSLSLSLPTPPPLSPPAFTNFCLLYLICDTLYQNISPPFALCGASPRRHVYLEAKDPSDLSSLWILWPLEMDARAVLARQP